MHSRTELAVEQLNEVWLERCRLLPEPPGNTVGDLLKDGTDAMHLLSECATRHNALIDYLRPVVKNRSEKE